MQDLRIRGFRYNSSDGLPKGVVFFGTDGKGLFHQMTRNIDPTPEDDTLQDAVDETIRQAIEMTEEGSSVGFDPPIYAVYEGKPYARTSSVLTSSAKLSLAENLFFLNDDNRLVQIQCGTLLSDPIPVLRAQKDLRKRLREILDALVPSVA